MACLGADIQNGGKVLFNDPICDEHPASLGKVPLSR